MKKVWKPIKQMTPDEYREYTKEASRRRLARIKADPVKAEKLRIYNRDKQRERRAAIAKCAAMTVDLKARNREYNRRWKAKKDVNKEIAAYSNLYPKP
jgi:hypothetical protein